ncbi:MAG: macro domain-containing protein [Alphaproteobacteria bacterium]|nr:MAG: macro domain-containing protein [Alphaproteobacteria bacterium]
MIRLVRDGVSLECIQGDITKQPDIDAVVNAANAQLRPGGGVAGAIHRAAGPGLDAECRPLAPIAPGAAVITGAHNLPNRHVVHCLGPVYGRDTPAPRLLGACYRNALLLADRHGDASIAFPAISTGAFGYPAQEAAQIALDTVCETLPRLRSLKRIRFVLFGVEDLKRYQALLRRHGGAEGDG